MNKNGWEIRKYERQPRDEHAGAQDINGTNDRTNDKTSGYPSCPERKEL
ncbi:MAG TPA: hypothetical protein VN328_10055 [Thermodesulfovibrionales bacterium]|nr:hypothetical protein [Thermodesulfovibrionales bacterium]